MLAPPRPPAHDELEALIREARARQQRRWLLAAAVTAVVAGAVLAGHAVFQGKRSGGREDHSAPRGIAAGRRCSAEQVRLGQPRFDGAGTGHVMENMSFTNLSSRSCTLRGWPSLVVVMPDGYRVPARVGRIRNATSSRALPERTVLLRPGEAASFHAYEDDGTGLAEICPFPLPSARVLVVPPGSSTPASGAVRIPYCRDRRKLLVWLSPLVSGRLDRYTFR